MEVIGASVGARAIMVGRQRMDLKHVTVKTARRYVWGWKLHFPERLHDYQIRFSKVNEGSTDHHAARFLESHGIRSREHLSFIDPFDLANMFVAWRVEKCLGPIALVTARQYIHSWKNRLSRTTVVCQGSAAPTKESSSSTGMKLCSDGSHA